MTTKAPEQDRGAIRLRHLQDEVKKAGIKLTPQRLEIFRELASSETHPDAEAVLRAVQQRMPMVSLDTVYRTLWLLRDLGLVKTLGPNRDVVRFDVNIDRHHHYVCVRCGLVRDFQSEDFDALRIPRAVQGFGSVVDAQVEVRGLCSTCQGDTPTPTAERPPGKKQKKNEPKVGSSRRGR